MSKRIYLILFIALISVSSTAVVIRYVELVPALTLAFWRMLSASLFLWCYSIKSPQRLISLNNRSRILFAGFFLGMHFALFFVGVRSTSVASATLLANTGPIFTSLFQDLVDKRCRDPLFSAYSFLFLVSLLFNGQVLERREIITGETCSRY